MVYLMYPTSDMIVKKEPLNDTIMKTTILPSIGSVKFQ